MKSLNQTDFARHIGVSKGYVTQLKQAGRLVFAEGGKIDVEASMLLINKTADPNRDDVKARHDAARAKEPSTKSSRDGKMKDPNMVTFSEGRAKEQHFKALQAELEYKKNIGELVAKVDMQAAVADVVTGFRQKLENLPHRVSAELVGQDLQYIRTHLKQEAHDILNELSKEFTEKVIQYEAKIS